MDAKKRRNNEREFPSWKTSTNGGRIYSKEVLARRKGWKALYVKEVDAEETTLNFRQEIYNAENILIEIHQKYPEDTGHKKLKQ